MQDTRDWYVMVGGRPSRRLARSPQVPTQVMGVRGSRLPRGYFSSSLSTSFLSFFGMHLRIVNQASSLDRRRIVSLE